MDKLPYRWPIAAVAIVALIFVAGAPADDALAAQKEKGPRCSDGIDNDGDGLIDGDDPDCGGGGGDGGDGGDPGFPRVFTVTVSGDAVAAPGACNNADGNCDNQATIDEDQAQTFNAHKKNPGTRYHTLANLYAINNINVSSLVLTDVPGNGSCTGFFASRGGAGADVSGNTVTWTGFMQASMSLDLTAAEGKYDRRPPKSGPTWTEIGSGRAVKGRITAPNLQWNLRFDEEWRPDSASIYDSFPDKAQDGAVVPVDIDADGLNDLWTVSISGRVLAQSYSGDGLGAMCNVNISWTVTRN